MRFPWHCANCLTTPGRGSSTGTYPPDEIAVALPSPAGADSFLPDGNGRHARLMADLLVMRLGDERFSWGAPIYKMPNLASAISPHCRPPTIMTRPAPGNSRAHEFPMAMRIAHPHQQGPSTSNTIQHRAARIRRHNPDDTLAALIHLRIVHLRLMFAKSGSTIVVGCSIKDRTMDSLYQRLKELDPDTFQRLCFQLLKERHPEQDIRHVEGASGDKGLDVFAGELYGKPAIWQCKAFPNGVGKSQKQQIRESLRTALKNFSPAHWNLCLTLTWMRRASRWFEKLKNVQCGQGEHRQDVCFRHRQRITS